MPGKVKVLRILNRFNLGGPVYNASYLTKYLSDDFDTLLIGGKKLDEEEDATYIPERLGISYRLVEEMSRSVSFLNDLKAYSEIKGIIDEFRPDIIHTHASKAGALGRFAAIQKSVPVIVHTFHGHVFEHYFGRLKSQAIVSFERFLASKSSALVAISKTQKLDLCDRFRIAPSEKVHVVPLGFELERFKTNKTENREAFRNKYDLKEDDVVFSIIGRFAPVKNHKLFLESFSELSASNKNVKAFLVGDGEIRAVLEEFCLDKGLKLEGPDQNVYFTSWMKDISPVLHGSDVVVLTSVNEGTPVSLIEAQASGTPVISSEVGGVKDVVGESSGLLFESKNASALLNCMKMLTDSPTMRTKMGAAGENFAFAHFTANRLAEDTKKLYLSLLNREA